MSSETLSKKFLDDRKDVFPLMSSPKFKINRPHALGRLRSILLDLENSLPKEGKFFLNTSAPTYADLHVGWAVRFGLYGIGLTKEQGFGRDKLPTVYQWMDQYMSWIKDTPGTIINGEAAYKLIAESSSSAAPTAQVDTTDPLVTSGLVNTGNTVSISQLDAPITHPQEGTLIGLDSERFIIKLPNDIVMHFPRLQSRLS